MSDILRQYDWNNHKAVNQKKLTELFVKLTLSDKITVYRILSNRRKLLLRKGYDKWKIENRKRILEVKRKYALAPLSDLIDTEELKTDKEVILTMGLIISDGFIGGYYDANSSNRNTEEERFTKIKQKFIGWYEEMHVRRTGFFPHEEDSFYVKLQGVEYTPPTTLIEKLKQKREKWKRCYIHIDVLPIFQTSSPKDYAVV